MSISLFLIADKPLMAQYTIKSIEEKPKIKKQKTYIYDSLSNIRVSKDIGYYSQFLGQDILFYPRNPNSDLKEVNFINFEVIRPKVLRIDTVWLKKRINNNPLCI